MVQYINGNLKHKKKRKKTIRTEKRDRNKRRKILITSNTKSLNLILELSSGYKLDSGNY